jgi:hypothetical protein
VLRRKELCKKKKKILFYFHISFGPSLSCPWLLLLLYTLRRAESDIIVEASGDEITVMEREEEDLHLQAKGAHRIHTTHCVYYLSLFLCVCCVWWLRCLGVVAVVGWLRIFLSFSFFYQTGCTHTHTHPLTSRREGTHPSIGHGECEGKAF